MVELIRECPNCNTVAEGEPYDIGSGPEFNCRMCDWCWGANGQPLNPDDPRRLPRDVIDRLPAWARSSFIPKD